MLGACVSGYQQKAGRGARDKAQQADSLRAIRRSVTGSLSGAGRWAVGKRGCAGEQATSIWSFGIAFIRDVV